MGQAMISIDWQAVVLIDRVGTHQTDRSEGIGLPFKNVAYQKLQGTTNPVEVAVVLSFGSSPLFLLHYDHINLSTTVASIVVMGAG